jgi:uncharacterized membrane protein
VSGRARSVLRAAALVLVVAALVHVVALWLLPRVIMRIVIDTAGREAVGGRVAPPPVDHTARRIVMPSPDLLYALCPYDVSRGPLRFTLAVPPGDQAYWSLAFYAANTDNYRVINDRSVTGDTVDLLLVREGNVPRGPSAATVLRSPSDRGVMLFRALVRSPADLERAEALRRGLRCAPQWYP